MADYATAMNLSLSKVKRLKLQGRIPYIQEGQIVRIPAQATDYAWLTLWRHEQGIAS